MVAKSSYRVNLTEFGGDTALPPVDAAPDLANLDRDIDMQQFVIVPL